MAQLSIGYTQDIKDYWLAQGLSPSLVTKLDPLLGKKLRDWAALRAELFARLTNAELTELDNKIRATGHLPLYRVLEVGPMKGFYANGWMGQYLYVWPERHLVAVRMHYPTPEDYGANPPDTEFRELLADVVALLPP